jgi:hypothetical protein
LPQTVDELARRIESFWSVLENCQSLEDVRAARRFNPALRASLEGYSDETVFDRLKSLHGGNAQMDADAAEDPRIAEFQLLASGAPLIGENHPRANLHAVMSWMSIGFGDELRGKKSFSGSRRS